MFRGQGMGGGAGGGGNMMRHAGRALARGGAANGGLNDSLSSSSSGTGSAATASRASQKHSLQSSNHRLSGNSLSPFPLYNDNPLSPTYGTKPTWPAASQCDEAEWVSVDTIVDENGNGNIDDFILGPVPSIDEVQDAVSSIHRVFGPVLNSHRGQDKFTSAVDRSIVGPVSSPSGFSSRVASARSEMDWIEPSWQPCHTGKLQVQGVDNVYDAFHLLHADPCVQRMVISLSSDRAVWDAVLNNEVVQELRQSFNAAEGDVLEIPDETSDDPGSTSSEAPNVVKWIFNNAKAKVMELISNMMKLVNAVMRPVNDGKTAKGAAYAFEEKLRTSFLLSIVVLLVVVVTRDHKG